jgi:hypothetical protein
VARGGPLGLLSPKVSMLLDVMVMRILACFYFERV